jgi:hypothetical protein
MSRYAGFARDGEVRQLTGLAKGQASGLVAQDADEWNSVARPTG